jgi:hypothetical protein
MTAAVSAEETESDKRTVVFDYSYYIGSGIRFQDHFSQAAILNSSMSPWTKESCPPTAPTATKEPTWPNYEEVTITGDLQNGVTTVKNPHSRFAAHTMLL